jgi:hypothetical protein
MKIYNKIVWDKDGNVIEEDSYEYEGPVAQAMGGRPKPPPPPPPPPPAPKPKPAPEPEPEPMEEEAEAVAEATKETTERKRRSGRRGLTTGSPLGYDQPFIGNRRSLL